MSEQLAGAGYLVFAIDRLGYAGSPYQPGSGWALTLDSYVEMTHEMVAQIREGTYRITDGTCDAGVGEAPGGRPADKVVLIGYSSSAFIAELYAIRYKDIDGIVSIGWSSANSSSAFFDEVIRPEIVERQWTQGKDYVYLLWGPNGTPAYSESCEKWLFYAGGVSRDVIEHTCGAGYFGGKEPRLMPSAEMSDLIGKVVAGEFRDRIGDIAPTPVLLVFAEQDLVHPRNGLGNELQMWSDECVCDFDVLWQERAGHSVLHDSTPETTAGIIEWFRTGEVPVPKDPPTNGVSTAPCAPSEQYATLGPAGRHEDVAPPIDRASFSYRLDVSGSADVPDATSATIQFRLTWDDLSDFDMYVYDSDGLEIGRSLTITAEAGRGIETILHFETAHCTDLRVDIVNFAGSPTSNVDLDVTVFDLAPTTAA